MKLDTDKHGLFSRLLSAGSNSYGFTGELTDGNGLLYLRARYLAPGLGTFASRDPRRGRGSEPQAIAQVSRPFMSASPRRRPGAFC
ncbi:MAG: hypothetical protein IT298_16130 [Chloroflexi bacterium]|nr:hypothetical protein [Chloroflexota bacterium]